MNKSWPRTNPVPAIFKGKLAVDTKEHANNPKAE